MSAKKIKLLTRNNEIRVVQGIQWVGSVYRVLMDGKYYAVKFTDAEERDLHIRLRRNPATREFIVPILDEYIGAKAGKQKKWHDVKVTEWIRDRGYKDRDLLLKGHDVIQDALEEDYAFLSTNPRDVDWRNARNVIGGPGGRPLFHDFDKSVAFY